MPQRIREIRIESAQNVQMASNEVRAITSFIEAVDAVVPLELASVVTLAPLQYRYRLEFADGRTWTQIITLASATDADPAMTFTVPPPGLRLSEFTTQRQLRDAIIGLIVKRGLATLVFEFNP